jgi:shikimate dehydrogenase
VQEAFALFRQNDFLGVNITIPHKFEALEAVDELDPLARQLGAVNTLAIREGRLFGYNTDGPGFLRSAHEAFGVPLTELRILILGAGGGAGRAVAMQCALAGAGVSLANRTSEKTLQLQADIRALVPGAHIQVAATDPGGPYLATRDEVELAHMIVNATSLGMKDTDPDLIPPDALRADQFVFDMVYRASGATPLIQAAGAAGAKYVDGMSLLLHQGAISFEHWFNQPAPLEVMRAGLKAA